MSVDACTDIRSRASSITGLLVLENIDNISAHFASLLTYKITEGQDVGVFI